MQINLKEQREEIIKEFHQEISVEVENSDKKDRATYNFMIWISNLKGLAKSEVSIKGSFIRLSSSASNLFAFGYDNIIGEPFAGVHKDLYSNFFSDLPIKYAAIRNNGIMLALFEPENRIVFIIKSRKSMLRPFYEAYKGKDTLVFRPHDYKDALPGKLKEVPLIKDNETLKREFLM